MGPALHTIVYYYQFVGYYSAVPALGYYSAVPGYCTVVPSSTRVVPKVTIGKKGGL